jgi:hypothetical protein
MRELRHLRHARKVLFCRRQTNRGAPAMPEPRIAQVEQEHDTVVAKLRFSSEGQLASLISQYGPWAAAAVSTGVL